jgi:endonuclease YncB( thermonuclease family)
MSSHRIAVGRRISNDPFIGSLLIAFLGLPALVALVIGGHALANNQRPAASPSPVATPQPVDQKPIHARVVMRPTASLAMGTPLALGDTPSPSAQIAMAFAPPERVARAPSPKPPVDDLPTASMPRPLATSSVERVAILRDVRVGDGLSLIGASGVFALAGVEPLAPDAMCRRLDGVEQPCSQRAASRLELLTRGRVVTCQPTGPMVNAQSRGACLAGKINLADDLVKNGLARRV